MLRFGFCKDLSLTPHIWQHTFQSPGCHIKDVTVFVVQQKTHTVQLFAESYSEAPDANSWKQDDDKWTEFLQWLCAEVPWRSSKASLLMTTLIRDLERPLRDLEPQHSRGAILPAPAWWETAFSVQELQHSGNTGSHRWDARVQETGH